MLRAVEGHVLDEMRQALLIVVFENRPRLDDEAELGALFWSVVGAHVVAQAVRESAQRDVRVERHRLGERRRLKRVGRRRLLRDAQRSGEEEDRGDQRHLDPFAKSHGQTICFLRAAWQGSKIRS